MVVVFSSSVTSAEDEDVEPLAHLPAGWVYLRQSGTDAWQAHYHDSKSGAFVEFTYSEKGSKGQVAFWRRPDNSDPSDTFVEGSVRKIPYGLVAMEDGRGRLERVMARDTHTTAASPWLEELLPPPDSKQLVLSFHSPDEGVWNFLAAVCNGAQESRVKNLLLGGARFNFAKPPTVSVSHGAPRTGYETLKDGMSFREVVGKLGMPESSLRQGCDGFKIRYYVATTPSSGSSVKKLELVFSMSQRLAKRQLE